MFQGASSLNLDAKGRLAIPTRHRDALMQQCGGAMTVTRSPDGCLMVFPRNEWVAFSEKVRALPSKAQWFKRIYLGSASDVEMDGSGRLLIAPELREAAGLSKESLLLGMGGYFELWDKATYEAKEAEALEQDMSEVLGDFSF